jgi:hypothetical protein
MSERLKGISIAATGVAADENSDGDLEGLSNNTLFHLILLFVRIYQ